MSSEQPNSSLREIFANNRGLAVVAALIGVGFIAMVILVIVLLLRPNDDATIEATPTPLTTMAADKPLVVAVSDTDTISVTLDVPATLQVGARSFAVQTQRVAADRAWAPTFNEPDTAVWVYGTIVNYIIGLADTEENRTLLEQLAPGDQMMLTTRNDVSYAFAFNSREQVLVGNPDVYAQQTPGLTLLLVGSEGEDRLAVNGRYIVDETSAAGAGQGAVVELGETAQLDNLQLTVTGAVHITDRPEAQPGFAFYLVDYQVQNVGLTAIDSSRLRLTLQDELGNQYAVSPAAAQLGNYPTLSGSLNASQTAQATAGYQIPIGMNSANVLWLVTHEATGTQLQVTIPFGGGAQAAQNTQVTLTQAAVSTDLTSLTLTGNVTNLGDQSLIVSERDIALQTNDGSVYLQLSTNPAFPWTIAPGQSVPYAISFQRPITADSAVFTVLNQSFQLSNLR
ncbi:MAG: DUF4352 domain-containing protein [Chloroflexi bacterium]|nr:DUF4352 domain-containing protein [Chloroflexota bacterium]